MFRPEQWRGQKVGIVGLGKSGQAVAKMLYAAGMDVLISEDAAVPANKVPEVAPGISVETGGHSAALFACDFWVKSPGISPRVPVLLEAKKKGIPVFSELEVALSFLPKEVRIFAVTGTNGKTTTTALLGEILKAQARVEGRGRQVWVCGNIGKPVSSCVNEVRA